MRYKFACWMGFMLLVHENAAWLSLPTATIFICCFICLSSEHKDFSPFPTASFSPTHKWLGMFWICTHAYALKIVDQLFVLLCYKSVEQFHWWPRSGPIWTVAIGRSTLLTINLIKIQCNVCARSVCVFIRLKYAYRTTKLFCKVFEIRTSDRRRK